METIDTPPFLTYLCDADLRNVPAFREAAEHMTLAEAIELHEAMEKAASAGGSSRSNI